MTFQDFLMDEMESVLTLVEEICRHINVIIVIIINTKVFSKKNALVFSGLPDR